jgi:hypothetical protein
MDRRPRRGSTGPFFPAKRTQERQRTKSKDRALFLHILYTISLPPPPLPNHKITRISSTPSTSHSRKSPPLLGLHPPSQLRTRIIPQPMNKPPHSRQERNARQNNTIIIHRRDCYWQRIREAENDIEKYNRDECHGIYRKAVFSHPERSSREIFPSCEEMASDSKSIRSRRQNNKRAHEIRKRGV